MGTLEELERKAELKEKGKPQITLTRPRLMELIINRPRPFVTACVELLRAKTSMMKVDSPTAMKKLQRKDDYAT